MKRAKGQGLVIIIKLRMRRPLVYLLELVKSVTKMVTGCLRPTKVAIFEVHIQLKGVKVKYEQYRNLSIYKNYNL